MMGVHNSAFTIPLPILQANRGQANQGHPSFKTRSFGI
jgi:hypothetical protein